MAGRTTHHGTYSPAENRQAIYTGHLANGVYLLRLIAGDQIINQKLIIQHP